MMAFSIRELEHKNKELRERVKPMQQLREALARAQEKLEDSEAVTRDAHAARAEAALLGDTVRNLEARLKGAEADKDSAVVGLRVELDRFQKHAAAAQVRWSMLLAANPAVSACMRQSACMCRVRMGPRCASMDEVCCDGWNRAAWEGRSVSGSRWPGCAVAPPQRNT